MSTSNVSEFYDNFSARQLIAGVNSRHRTILRRAKKHGLFRAAHVLEIGCGIGTVTRLLARFCSKGHVTAVDISPRSIEIAKKRLAGRKNVTFMAGDVVQAELEGTFDFIVLPDVIEHIPLAQHDHLFRSLSAALKPEGKILINIPDPGYLSWCHANRPDLLQIIDQPISLGVLFENTNRNNLQITSQESYGLWVSPFDYQFIVLCKRHSDFASKHVNIVMRVWNKLHAAGRRLAWQARYGMPGVLPSESTLDSGVG